MGSSTIVMTSLLALASPATAQTASARLVGAHQSGVSLSSATGVDERGNPVIAGGAIVTPPTGGDSLPESINSFPPGFTDLYLAHR